MKARSNLLRQSAEALALTLVQYLDPTANVAAGSGGFATSPSYTLTFTLGAGAGDEDDAVRAGGLHERKRPLVQRIYSSLRAAAAV